MPNLSKCSWEKWSLNIVWKLFFFKNKFFQKYIFLMSHSFRILGIQDIVIKNFSFENFFKISIFFLYFLFIYFFFHFSKEKFLMTIFWRPRILNECDILKKKFFEKIYFWKKKVFEKIFKDHFSKNTLVN